MRIGKTPICFNLVDREVVLFYAFLRKTELKKISGFLLLHPAKSDHGEPTQIACSNMLYYCKLKVDILIPCSTLSTLKQASTHRLLFLTAKSERRCDSMLRRGRNSGMRRGRLHLCAFLRFCPVRIVWHYDVSYQSVDEGVAVLAEEWGNRLLCQLAFFSWLSPIFGLSCVTLS